MTTTAVQRPALQGPAGSLYRAIAVSIACAVLLAILLVTLLVTIGLPTGWIVVFAGMVCLCAGGGMANLMQLLYPTERDPAGRELLLAWITTLLLIGSILLVVGGIALLVVGA